MPWLLIAWQSGSVSLFDLKPVSPFSNRSLKRKLFCSCLSSLFLVPGHFFCSTAPQAFFRPNHVSERLARAGHVKAGRFFSGHRRLGLYMTEHDGKLVGLGRKSASIRSCFAIRDCQSLPVTSFSSRSRVARRIMDLRKLRRRNVPNGITKVSREESRGRRGPSRQGRRFAKTAKGRNFYATSGVVGCQRNGCRVVHIRCRMTASLRATAMVAFLLPTFLARACPHACSAHGRQVRLSSTFAPS